MLHMGAVAPAIDGVIHPGAAALVWTSVEVQVELARDCAGAVEHVEEAHGRMPSGGGALANLHAEECFGNPEHSLEHPILREVLFHFLFGEAVPRLAELLGRVREVPRCRL